ncbi:ATP binding microtubule motor family protein [Forsythia ovata]|uniref:ATP binding microtubule motor family protein n=1 Tax=Forsythia ovata TaxID=205694 RepID=A0ABD1U646_9LAMI
MEPPNFKTDQDIQKSSSDWSTEFEPEKTTDDGSKTDQDIQKSASDWSTKFERQKREIIELWDTCCTPLVHRTYFLLLFKGDPSDAVYMEVELRRLSFLKNTLSSGQVSVKSSRVLNRERDAEQTNDQEIFNQGQRSSIPKMGH